MGVNKVATRAERDDMFRTFATNNQIKIKLRPTSGLIPINPPIKVATPFPPLKE